ncbi:phosphotransferase [Paenibacillus albidus]|uniref:phosphotransferase n=1 Tax=Paenibacillus albidus TaxID=2041023 RepID=UPI00166A5F4F|nr:phosphotransferase [Paenibacillus albidus]
MQRKEHKATEYLLKRHWPEWNGTIQQRAGGWNNTTFFVENRAKRAVLRIYNTHRDKDKIEFEHDILHELGQLPLSFQVPMPIPTESGVTLALTEEGKYACLFKYIAGESPVAEDTGYAFSFGEAAGEMSAALAAVNTQLSPVYRPYYELQHAYPLCSRDSIRELCQHPPEPLRELQLELNVLLEAYEDIVDSLSELEQLPHQLVHGDLNASNLLVERGDPGQVAALLDFEFCTRDVRAMEPAVILSGFLGEAGEEEKVKEFCRGYSRRVRLAEAEIAAFPTLMKLRKVDVFLHFVSRFLEGTDKSEVLCEQVKLLSADIRQLSARSLEMQEQMRQAMMEERK